MGAVRIGCFGDRYRTNYVSDLVHDKHEKFSLDMLVTRAARASRAVKLRLAAQPASSTITRRHIPHA
jgi:hypothetical protein